LDISNYLSEREHKLSKTLGLPIDEMNFELALDGQSARMWGNITLTDEVSLSVRERIELVDGRAHIVKYSYYIIVDGAEARGFDKEPTHNPPVHGHIGPNHAWTQAPEITLEAALDRCWDEVELYATTYHDPHD